MGDRDMGYGGGGGDRGGFEGGSTGRYQFQPPGIRPRRPQTDYGSTMVQWMRHRRRTGTRLEQERPSASYMIDIVPPAGRVTNPADTIPAKHLHSSLNKIKHPVNVVKWTPEGRRLLTGSSSGEFTLWHGMGFNFETIMSAHESAIRAAQWSHSADWLVSAGHDGVVKYWQPNFNNVNAIQAHEAPIRDLAFSPTDSKFVTASDDSTLKIWDFSRGIEESTLTGHGWDAKTADWHPTKGLLASGSKDHQVKLWDPRNGRCLTTLHGHKNTLSKVSFEPIKGQLLATCARDTTARIFDLRMMRDVLLLKGHEKDIMTLTWHPIHSSLLSTGAYDGALYHYLLDEPNQPDGTGPSISPYDSPDPGEAPAQTIYPAHRVSHAHESAIWSMDWHPLGHILATGSNDRITRFWTRPRPGETDCFKDRYHLGDAAAEAHGTWNRSRGKQQARDEDDQETDDEAEGLVDQQISNRQPMLPGLPNIAAALRDGTSVGGPQLPQLPGMGAALPPPPPPSFPFIGAGMLPPGMDPSKIPNLAQLAEMFGGKLPPPPVPMPGGDLHGHFPPPIPGPAGLPPGFPPPPLGLRFGSPVTTGYFGDADGANGAAGRRRIPLPSQQDSLQEEMKKGNFRTIR